MTTFLGSDRGTRVLGDLDVFYSPTNYAGRGYYSNARFKAVDRRTIAAFSRTGAALGTIPALVCPNTPVSAVSFGRC